MGYKNNLYNTILEEVSYETDICTEYITCVHEDADSVDAVYITIRLLYGVGFYPPTIAKLLHRTARSVNLILTVFRARYKLCPMVRIHYERIKNRLLVKGIYVL